MKKPNILLITCDQLRAHSVGCYGDPVARTPNMDRLAASGLRFEHGISSRPVCMAARSAMLSGQYPRRCTGGVGNICHEAAAGKFEMPEYPWPGRPHLPDKALPECLQESGYHTAAIGKWHLHSWPHDIGFQHYIIPRVHHAHSGQLYTENGGPEFAAPGWSLDYELSRAAEYLEQRADQEEPFFLYYNISPPHCPLSDAPERYLQMFREDEVPIRPNCDPDLHRPDQNEWYKIYRWDYRYYQLHLPYTETVPEGYGVRRLIADYYGLTSWVDDTLGTLLGHLERQGLADNTIVVFVSDHGDNLWSHGLIQKGSLNEESIRVPYIIRAQGISEPGSVSKGQVAGLVDLMPTLLELAGVECPAHVHGQSLAPVVRRECDALAQTHTFIETEAQVAVRTPRYTFGVKIDENRQLATDLTYFTDLQVDPYQLQNLAGEAAQAHIARELANVLRTWNQSTPWMDGTDH